MAGHILDAVLSDVGSVSELLGDFWSTRVLKTPSPSWTDQLS